MHTLLRLQVSGHVNRTASRVPELLCVESVSFAMASDSPDIQSLNTWKDAFQYPIPTVRRVEQELRRDIASNKEKLRSLVGYVSIFR